MRALSWFLRSIEHEVCRMTHGGSDSRHALHPAGCLILGRSDAVWFSVSWLTSLRPFYHTFWCLIPAQCPPGHMHLQRNGLQGLQSMQSQICCIWNQRKDRKCNSCVLGRWNVFSSTVAKHGWSQHEHLQLTCEKRVFSGWQRCCLLGLLCACWPQSRSQSTSFDVAGTNVYIQRENRSTGIHRCYRPHFPQAPIEVVEVVHFGAMPFTLQKLTKTHWYLWSAYGVSKRRSLDGA